MVTESATTTFEKLELDCGVTLAPVECAYETYGALNAGRTNAILVLHAFSGDAHAAGAGGWWANMIGPGKAFDTDKYFVDLLQCSGRMPRHHRARLPSIRKPAVRGRCAFR